VTAVRASSVRTLADVAAGRAFRLVPTPLLEVDPLAWTGKKKSMEWTRRHTEMVHTRERARARQNRAETSRVCAVVVSRVRAAAAVNEQRAKRSSSSFVLLPICVSLFVRFGGTCLLIIAFKNPSQGGKGQESGRE